MSNAAALAAPFVLADQSLGAGISVSLSIIEPSQTAKPQRINGEEKAASQRENSPSVLASAFAPFTSYRSASRGPLSLGAPQAIPARWRDEALLAWLVSQPDTKKTFDDFGKVETRESDSVIDSSDLYADSVEQVFAQLTSN